jgi:hypothetical protein
MENINIVYIDDNLDFDLIKYLRDYYQYDGINKVFDQVAFHSDYSYEKLLTNDLVTKANVIIIDSKLFEDSHVTNGKFTGEEFELILKKEYAFIEVIIISQNELFNNKYVKKFVGSRGMSDGIEYYKVHLTSKLDDAIQNVLYYRSISKKFRQNDNIDKRMVEKILESIDGINVYDDFKKKDVDEIIKLFKEIQEHYGKRL